MNDKLTKLLNDTIDAGKTGKNKLMLSIPRSEEDVKASLDKISEASSKAAISTKVFVDSSRDKASQIIKEDVAPRLKELKEEANAVYVSTVRPALDEIRGKFLDKFDKFKSKR